MQPRYFDELTQLTKLIENPLHTEENKAEIIVDAVKKYAQLGDIDVVFKLKNLYEELSKQSSNSTYYDNESLTGTIIFGFAYGGHIAQAESFLLANLSHIQNFILGYSHGNSFDNNILRLLFLVENTDLRQKIINELQKKNMLYKRNIQLGTDLENLSSLSARLYPILKEYPTLTIKQTQALLQKHTRPWMLFGKCADYTNPGGTDTPSKPDNNAEPSAKDQQIFSPKLLPPELYFHLLTFVLGLSDQDTVEVFNAVNINIFNKAKSRIEENGSLNETEKNARMQKLGENYQRRMAW